MTRPAGVRAVWVPIVAMVLAEIGYPLVGGDVRAGLVVLTVLLGYAASVGHAMTRGPAVAATLVAVTTGGGLGVELLGVATGVPFGGYAYTGALGPRLAGVPLVIALAWTWMAWPAWLAATWLTARPAARVVLAGAGLAGWDLFLDPQMVTEGYWHWADPTPALPGVAGIPLSNYLGWYLVAVTMMALLARAMPAEAPPRPTSSARPDDLPMLVMYLWTYLSSTMALAVFLGLPAAAGWGALGMGAVAVPLAVRLCPRPCRAGR